MKIISYGSIKPEKASCWFCGAELEYTYADIKHLYTAAVDKVYVECPMCRNRIVVLEASHEDT
nr:MAG TPA_asm: trcl Probable zinc-ribbon domain [Caudoviricetes sp.]